MTPPPPHRANGREPAAGRRDQPEDRLAESGELGAISELATRIAHDLNGVLTAITGYVQLALLHVDPDTAIARDLRKAVAGSRRGSKLTQQLFDLFPENTRGLAASAARAAPATPTIHGHETVLLVEDEAMIRDVVVRLLEEHGYSLIIAQHPEQAEQLHAEQSASIDLLLTDMQLPGCSGRELYERLARQAPTLKVLFMSGTSDGVSEDGDIAAAGDIFIQKPFTLQDLLARVRTILDS